MHVLVKQARQSCTSVIRLPSAVSVFNQQVNASTELNDCRLASPLITTERNRTADVGLLARSPIDLGPVRGQ